MSVFVAYSDEAAIGDLDGEFLVSGYVANESEWPWFARAWQERVLDGPPVIPFFHMTQIRSRSWRKDFGVSYNESERRTEEAVKTIYSTGGLSVVGSAIVRSQLKEIIHRKYLDQSKRIEAGVDQPDYFCHLAFFYIVLRDVCANNPDIDKVNFVFAQKSTVITRNLLTIAKHTRQFLKTYSPELEPMMGEVLPGSPEAFLPLQAADVIAWHLQRYFSDRRSGVKLDATIERRKWGLLKEQNRHLYEWNRASLEHMAGELDKIGLA